MKKVTREELLDYQTYAEGREKSRPQVIALKEARRIHLGPYLTFLFENHDTTRYQIQEMMLAERIVKDADIRHELDTYNELLGGPGELGVTLLIEIETPAERDEKLSRWHGVPESLYLKLPDGSHATAVVDQRQIDDRRVSSVHYLRFDVKGQTPVAIGSTFPELKQEQPLTDAQKAALAADLAS